MGDLANSPSVNPEFAAGWLSACMKQVHGGLWAWPCAYVKDHDGPCSWDQDGARACVCHGAAPGRSEAAP